jgi:hypothetical protein
MYRRSLTESIVTAQEITALELTMIEIDISFIERKVLGCFFTALYRLRGRGLLCPETHLYCHGF